MVIGGYRISLSVVLLQDAGCDVLLRNLDGLQWRNRIENQGLPNSIRWTQQALQVTSNSDCCFFLSLSTRGIAEVSGCISIVARAH